MRPPIGIRDGGWGWSASWPCLLILLAGACTREELPTPESVVPNSGPGTAVTPIRILGRSFNPRVHASYDDESNSTVDRDFSAALGQHALLAVAFVSSTELSAQVPAGLPAGSYDLTVQDPRGQRGSLAAAFRIVGPGPADGGGDADGPGLDGPGRDGPALDGPGLEDGPAQQDAPSKLDLPGPCPPVCTNACAGGVCALSCKSNCACPAGWICAIACAQAGVCNGNIDCSKAQACTITCSGADSCSGNMSCGAGGCKVSCASGACTGNMSCSGKCAISCTGGSCSGNITCTGGPCSITCGSGSCQSVDCSSACSCSASCGTGACWSGLFCPTGCTSGSTCVTTPAATCDTC